MIKYVLVLTPKLESAKDGMERKRLDVEVCCICVLYDGWDLNGFTIVVVVHGLRMVDGANR